MANNCEMKDIQQYYNLYLLKEPFLSDKEKQEKLLFLKNWLDKNLKTNKAKLFPYFSLN